MTNYNEPHAVRDETKLAALIEAYRTNQDISPIVVTGDTAITGSHRIAACRTAKQLWESEAAGWENSNEPVLRAVEISQDAWDKACKVHDVEDGDLWSIGDYNDLCQAIYAATDDGEVKAALEDQIV
jgi:hypothetical protein